MFDYSPTETQDTWSCHTFEWSLFTTRVTVKSIPSQSGMFRHLLSLHLQSCLFLLTFSEQTQKIINWIRWTLWCLRCSNKSIDTYFCRYVDKMFKCIWMVRHPRWSTHLLLCTVQNACKCSCHVDMYMHDSHSEPCTLHPL